MSIVTQRTIKKKKKNNNSDRWSIFWQQQQQQSQHLFSLSKTIRVSTAHLHIWSGARIYRSKVLISISTCSTFSSRMKCRPGDDLSISYRSSSLCTHIPACSMANEISVVVFPIHETIIRPMDIRFSLSFYTVGIYRVDASEWGERCWLAAGADV